ncbi:hypothetical protein SO802_034470 [Lithocarpus litseifolius]|uniref:Uncharacterized protein n=1 Tax=Lithocarpus litseifolius TaxID=425828 RepID=A0AAW2BLL4_9ROSI
MQEGMRLQGEPGSGVLWSKDDGYAQVFGPERPGHVRGVGFGITSSRRSAINASQFTSTPSLPSKTTQRISELENNSSRLRWQRLMGTLHGNETVNLLVIGCTMMLAGKWLMKYHVLADKFL